MSEQENIITTSPKRKRQHQSDNSDNYEEDRPNNMQDLYR